MFNIIQAGDDYDQRLPLIIVYKSCYNEKHCNPLVVLWIQTNKYIFEEKKNFFQIHDAKFFNVRI